MLTEETSYDQVMVTDDMELNVRRVTRVLRDGVEIAKSYHRFTVWPGQKIDDMELSKHVEAVCASLWTSDVVEKYKKEHNRE